MLAVESLFASLAPGARGLGVRAKEQRMTEELKAALAKVKGREMTAAELDVQRISFAYGNAPEEDNGTKASVTRSLREARVAEPA